MKMYTELYSNNLLESVGSSTSHSPMVLRGLLQGPLPFYFQVEMKVAGRR
jgi:hypothetical protein